MERDQILDLYNWQSGVCFRHPGRGVIETAHVKTIRPRADGDKEIRACRECILAMEDIRREEAARSGREYEPGHVGKDAE